MNDASGRSRRVHAVSTLASGEHLSLNIHSIHGTHPGPTVGISAVIHGDELEGLLILRALWESIDPDTLRGTLRLLPVANPLALGTLSRNTPIDMLDLNRVFPGVPDGWLSEQLAFAIANEFLTGIDYYVDLHAGGVFPWVDYCYVVNDEALSRAFLSRLLYKPPQMFAGSTAAFASARNIPTMVVEIGGGYHDQAQHIANGVRGLTNQLRHLGLMAGPVHTRTDQLLLKTIKVIRPRNGGLCVPQPNLAPGTFVDGGTLLAEIVSPSSLETLETIVAPFEQNIVVLSRNYITRIHPGDYAFMIGDGATATPYA